MGGNRLNPDQRVVKLIAQLLAGNTGGSPHMSPYGVKWGGTKAPPQIFFGLDRSVKPFMDQTT
jgi:hypothetical protein